MKSYLDVRESSVSDNEASTEKKARSKIPDVNDRGDQWYWAHLPIVWQRRRAQQQPAIQCREVAKCQ